jgi:F-type H+-transporting ATPase subunit epsilon
MEDVLRLSILTLDRTLYDGEIKEIKTTSTVGGLEILKKHTPLITTLKPSITVFTDINGKEYKLFLSSGALKIEGNVVKILCESGEWPDEIDIRRAEASKNRAEDRLKEDTGVDMKRAEIALTKALLRLKVKE